MDQGKHSVTLRLVGGITLIGLLSVGMVLYSQWLSSRDFEQNASLIRMTQIIQQEIAIAHLWFEEALGGDSSIDLQRDVHAPIIAVRDLLDVGLSGGNSVVGRIAPPTEVRNLLLSLREDIELFERLVASRWARRETTGIIGGEEDQAFDAVFRDILVQSRSVAGQVDNFITTDQNRIFAINVGMLIILVGLFAAMAILIVLNRRAIEVRAAELEKLVGERTASLAAREAEARQRNEQLALARDEAHAASEAKSQFLANMSHEIRTPMNGVIGMASLLMRTDMSPKQREYVETMHGSGLSLLKIINEILDFSKIEAGKITLERTDFSLEASVADVLHLFSAEANQKNLKLESSLEDNVPVLLHGDPVRLGQILSNLVSNAIKFSENGDIVIVCQLSEKQPTVVDEVELRFEVRDCGVGIPEEQQAKLFEQFSQLDQSATRSYGGTGLGLAISKELATLMGGRIGVVSRPGEGSTFWFTARFSKPDEGIAEDWLPEKTFATETYATYTQNPAGLLLRPTSDKKVLVVDDNEVNLLVAQRMLEQLGFIVDLASDGQQAIDASSRQDYAAILMDSQMPGMDGNQATSMIRRMEGGVKHTPIIALTANAMAPERAKAFEAGVDEYLSKPVFIEDLEAALGRLGFGLDQGPTRVLSTSLTQTTKMSGDIFDQEIVEELRAISGSGKQDLFGELAGKFVEQMPEWLAELRTVAVRGETKLVARQAHKLSGLCQQIGALRMAQICNALESTHPEADDDEMLRTVDLLRDEFDMAQRELNARYLGE